MPQRRPGAAAQNQEEEKKFAAFDSDFNLAGTQISGTPLTTNTATTNADTNHYSQIAAARGNSDRGIPMGGRSNFNQTSYPALHDEEEKKLYQEAGPLELYATGMGRVAARVR